MLIATPNRRYRSCRDVNWALARKLDANRRVIRSANGYVCVDERSLQSEVLRGILLGSTTDERSLLCMTEPRSTTAMRFLGGLAGGSSS